MKRSLIALLVALLMGFGAPAMAEHGGKHDCPKGEQCPMKKDCNECEKGGRKDCDDKEGCADCPILAKTLKKAHWLLENSDELGLSDEQVEKVKSIKTAAKKDAIRMEAEMKIAHMDMEAALGQETLDVNALSASIDQGMAGWSQQAKTAIQRYAELKGVLTADQKSKAKALKGGKKDAHKDHKK